MMGKTWNLVGWLAITLIVPGLIFATMGGVDDDSQFVSHAATCKTCGAFRGESQLPTVIDGTNLRVINIPEAAVANTHGAGKLPHHL
jgi:hypothetical protein